MPEQSKEWSWASTRAHSSRMSFLSSAGRPSMRVSRKILPSTNCMMKKGVPITSGFWQRCRGLATGNPFACSSLVMAYSLSMRWALEWEENAEYPGEQGAVGFLPEHVLVPRGGFEEEGRVALSGRELGDVRDVFTQHAPEVLLERLLCDHDQYCVIQISNGQGVREVLREAAASQAQGVPQGLHHQQRRRVQGRHVQLHQARETRHPQGRPPQVPRPHVPPRRQDRRHPDRRTPPHLHHHPQLPINQKNKPTHVTIENIELTVTSISELAIIGDLKENKKLDDNESESDNYKKQKLRSWEENMAKYFEKLQPPSWGKHMADNMLDNMSITVKKLNLCFQNTSLYGYQTNFRLKIDEITLRTTDQNYAPKNQSDSLNIFKLITISRFSVSLQVEKQENTLKKYNLRDSENFVLHPIDIRIQMNIVKSSANDPKPKVGVSMGIDSPIIVMLNKDQKNYLIKVSNHLNTLETIQDNFHFRPQVQVKKNWVDWWKYSIQAVIEKQKQFRLDMNFSSQRILLMKKYVGLYKRKQNIIHVPWLNQWTSQDEFQFQYCEQMLSLKDLLKYREFALTEIRLEAKRYFKHNQTTNDQLDYQQIELQENERINLYELLEKDKLLVLSQLENNIDPNQTQLDFSLNINSVFLILLDNKFDRVYYIPENIQLYKNCTCIKCQKQNLNKQKYDQEINDYLQQQKKLYRKNLRLKSQIQNCRQVSKQQIEEEQSFFTANAGDEDFQSIFSEEESSQMEESQVQQQQQQNMQKRQTIRNEVTKCQKIIVIIELDEIRVKITQYKDEKVEAKGSSPITINDIRVMAPGALTKFVNSMDEHKTATPKFLLDVFDKILSSEYNLNYLIEFLEVNKMEHLSNFLYQYENDKNQLQGFTEENYYAYTKYFQPESPFFLHQDHFDLEQAYFKVLGQIRKYVYPIFLEEYGEYVLPNCINRLKQNQKALSPQPQLTLHFVFQPKPAEFKILRDQLKVLTPMSTLNVVLKPLKIFLTARSLFALQSFLDQDSNANNAKDSLFQNENHQLLNCIMKSEQLDSLEKLTTEAFKLNIQIIGPIKIVVISEAIFNNVKSETKLQIGNTRIETLSDYSNIYYQEMLVQVDEFSVWHKYIKNPECILTLSVSILIEDCFLKNHSILSDSKIYISIPSLRIQVSDNITGLLEIIQILSMKQPPPKKAAKNIYKNQQSDSILVSQLSKLFRDHKHQSTNCRHCIIKFTKSLVIVNLVIGNIDNLLTQSVTQDSWIYKLYKYSRPYQQITKYSKSGFEFEFKNSNRVAEQASSSTVFCLPLILITKDQGFFKDNITVHCSRSWVLNSGIKSNSPSNHFGEKKSIIQSLQGSEINFIHFEPYYEVKNEIINKLDDNKHIVYCRQLAKEIFKVDFKKDVRISAEIQESVDIEQNNDFNKLYLMFYNRQPVRQDLLQEIEKNLPEKEFKNQIYLRLKKIWLKFTNPIAACTMISILQNISSAMKIVENAWQTVYKTSYSSNEESRSRQKKQQNDSPIHSLDCLMMSFSICSLYYSVQLGGEDKFITFLINALNVEYNLDLMNNQVSNSIISQEISKMPFQTMKGPQSDVLGIPRFDGSSVAITNILRCNKIQLNFSNITKFEINDVNVSKIQNTIRLTIKEIQIKNQKFKSDLLLIPSSIKARENNYALTINLEFISALSEIRIHLARTQISLSKENIQEFILSSSTIVLILIQELRAYQNYLKSMVYLSEYKGLYQSFDYFDYKKKKSESEQEGSQDFRTLFDFEKLTIEFHQKGQYFFKIYLDTIQFQQKYNQEIEAEIKQVGLCPYPQQLDNFNLICPASQNTPIKIKFVMKEMIHIQLDNIQIEVISLYLNELAAFGAEIEQEIKINNEQIIGYLPKAQRKQLIEEMETQIKNQTKIKLYLVNSAIRLPEDSSSLNYIRVFFQRGEILVHKEKTQVDIPLLGEIQQKDNLIVDEQEKSESQLVHINRVDVKITKIEAIYNLNQLQGKLFYGDEVQVMLYTPMYPWVYGQLYYKTTAKVTVKDLNMQMDLGKIFVIQELVEKNTKEQSKLFEKHESLSLDKLTFEVTPCSHLSRFDINQIDFSQEKYTFFENNQDQIMDQDEENFVDSDSD